MKPLLDMQQAADTLGFAEDKRACVWFLRALEKDTGKKLLLGGGRGKKLLLATGVLRALVPNIFDETDLRERLQRLEGQAEKQALVLKRLRYRMQKLDHRPPEAEEFA